MGLRPFENFKDLNIAITGGAGFIGSHLTEKLLLLGAKVAVIDNFLYCSKMEHFKEHKCLQIYNSDIRDTKYICRLLKNRDLVFHLAAVVGVEETQSSPFDVLDVEIEGTINILNAASSNKVKRFIFGSSSEVYGDSLEPMKEGASLSPKSTYAVAKLVGEEYCKAFYQKYGMQYTILRYFNIYGPRQDERFVISRFVKRTLENEVIYIYGDGKQTRDFTYIDDAINMTLLAAAKDEPSCQIINIGTGVSTTINELALMITEMFNNKHLVKQVYVDYDNKRPREIEVFSRVADITKAKRLLQYEPNINLKSGIKKLYNVL
jgi:UDP-glucose 4-epimerase